MLGLYNLKQELYKKGVIFCYSGPISHGIVEEIGDAIKFKMQIESSSHIIAQKVFAIFVEQVQNIMSYSAEVKYDKKMKLHIKSGIVIIGRDDDVLYVESGNLIKKESKKILTDKLEKIKKMNKHELKNYYKQQLQKDQEEFSNGAGLGLIDIARKSSKKMEYLIQDIDEEYSFFSIKVAI